MHGYLEARYDVPYSLWPRQAREQLTATWNEYWRAGGLCQFVNKILENSNYSFGFDAQGGEYVDLVKKGIIDPTKVVRQALQGASSVAGLLITTEAMVAELPKKKDSMPAMPPGGGGMDF